MMETLLMKLRNASRGTIQSARDSVGRSTFVSRESCISNRHARRFEIEICPFIFNNLVFF